jgi:transposase
MGVAPREHSTGSQQKPLGISKRGNFYLRRLFVQSARAVNRCPSTRTYRELAAILINLAFKLAVCVECRCMRKVADQHTSQARFPRATRFRSTATGTHAFTF